MSGSGKSSLAFDTIYAEGQRRYVESLSAYARQFLGQMDKPDVDSIEGLSPAISIDQKTTSRNPRSTVGTVTEIYDYLRLLWARVGHPHCHVCGAPIAGQSVEQIVDQVMELDEGTRFMVMAPIVRGRKGEYGKVFDELRTDGYARVKVDGELKLLEDPIELDKKFKHDISVVVDRLVLRHDVRKRLVDSVETAVALADGIIEIELLPRDGTPGQVLQFSERFACLKCGTSMPELEPRIFSFNSPHGACERCTGLGSQREIDPELIVPDPALSIAEGALAPWANSSSSYYEQIMEAIAERYGADLETPWASSPPAHQDLFLYGTNGEPVKVNYRNRYGRTRSYETRFEGIIPNLQRRYKETDSEFSREKIEEYMSVRPCPACKGSRLRPESRAVLVGGLGIHEFVRLSVVAALRWLDEVQLTETERHIARLILREISERLRFLENVGIGYLSMDRAAATLSGGEAQRIRLATQIGSSLVGVLYILDEPSIGLHQRDNSKLIRTLERLRDLGNTVIVVEHDEQTMRAADHVIDMGPGAGEHGGEVVAEGTAAEIERVERSLTGQFLARTRVIDVPSKRRKPSGHVEIRGAAQNNLKSIDVRVPLGVLTAVTGVSGSGKSTLVNEVLYKSVANRLHRARSRAGRHTAILGLDQLDKIIASRPVADRAHPALEPRDVHGPVRRHARPVLKDAGGACARLQARPLLVQRQGRALRGLPRRRPDQDRDALPARRLRAVRAVPRQALQPRDARRALQGQDDRRRARDARRGGARVLPAHPEDPAPAGDAERGRARLHPPRPAGDDAVGRRGAAREARDRAVEGRDGAHAVHPRRADDRPALRRRAAAARGPAPARRPGQLASSSSSTTSTSSRPPTGSSTWGPRVARPGERSSRRAPRRRSPAPPARTRASTSRRSASSARRRRRAAAGRRRSRPRRDSSFRPERVERVLVGWDDPHLGHLAVRDRADVHDGHVEDVVAALTERAQQRDGAIVVAQHVERLDTVGSAVCAWTIEKYLPTSCLPEKCRIGRFLRG